jgi:hypothetical protein
MAKMLKDLLSKQLHKVIESHLHSAECERIKQNLHNLGRQTQYLTQGDLSKVKRREGRVKFKPDRDP